MVKSLNASATVLSSHVSMRDLAIQIGKLPLLAIAAAWQLAAQESTGCGPACAPDHVSWPREVRQASSNSLDIVSMKDVQLEYKQVSRHEEAAASGYMASDRQGCNFGDEDTSTAT